MRFHPVRNTLKTEIIREALMLRRTVHVILFAAALASGGLTAAIAQEKPPGTPIRTPGQAAPAAGPSNKNAPSTAAKSRARLLCFWRAPAGGPFGASGTCNAIPTAIVGSQCSCKIGGGVGIAGHYRAGKVIQAPLQGPSPVLRWSDGTTLPTEHSGINFTASILQHQFHQ